MFAAHARLRPAVTALVPGATESAAHSHHATAAPPRPHAPSRLPWAEIFRRVFRDDVLVCPRCAGAMHVLAAITDPEVVAAILLALPTENPAPAPARAPPLRAAWPGAFDSPPAHDDLHCDTFIVT